MKLSHTAYQGLWKAVDWIYPPVCAGCGTLGFRFCPSCYESAESNWRNFCTQCGKPVKKNYIYCGLCTRTTPEYSSSISWAPYDGPLREAILKLKYKQDLGLGEEFSKVLINMLNIENWIFDLIIPIPITRSHQKTRGYNQSSLISFPISLYFKVPYSKKAVVRIKESTAQVNLSYKERILNQKDAFFGNPAKLNNMKVLIVDDVITTGATMRSCMEAILTAGAKQVYGISVAKTIKHH